MEISEWKKLLEEERAEKDWFFAKNWQSPVSTKDRSKLKGLDYFLLDPNYRLEVELHEHKKKETVKMAYTKGEEQDFIKWGEFRFEVDGKELVLQAYKRLSIDETLFVPFRDATSGKETYSAGRYLDLNSAISQTPEGKWILDFNKAYNPWCVYSDMYTCPFVPLKIGLRYQYRQGKGTIH
jgi:uncharacterized protein (DUF1684 family)